MNIAEGSVHGNDYYLVLVQDLGYGQTGLLMSSLDEVGRLLSAYGGAILTPLLKIRTVT
jgi:hypothetical protein